MENESESVIHLFVVGIVSSRRGAVMRHVLGMVMVSHNVMFILSSKYRQVNIQLAGRPVFLVQTYHE